MLFDDVGLFALCNLLRSQEHSMPRQEHEISENNSTQILTLCKKSKYGVELKGNQHETLGKSNISLQ